MMATLLEMSNVCAFYGKSQVLFDVSLAVSEGEMVALIGRNGMGKTTLIRCVMGLKPPVFKGTIVFKRQRINGLPPERIARLGIAIVPEGRQIFPNLTVEENLIAFADNRSGTPSPWTLADIWRLFPRLHERRNNLGSQLSGGEQQMLAIGRALMTNPHLLILDEATEGLAPLLKELVWGVLRELRERGQTVLVVDKHVDRLLELADRGVVLEKGRVVLEGRTSTLRQQTELLRRYLSV
jgi:branched-chain amino acid transport system ATP-binding protein